MQTLADHDADTVAIARSALAEYRAVFGEWPDVECVSSPSGVESVVFSGWLWLYRSDDAAGRWSVRIRLPADPWFHQFECLRSRDGYTVEKPSLDEALVYLFQHEAHRRCHQARDTRTCRR